MVIPAKLLMYRSKHQSKRIFGVWVVALLCLLAACATGDLEGSEDGGGLNPDPDATEVDVQDAGPTDATDSSQPSDADLDTASHTGDPTDTSTADTADAADDTGTAADTGTDTGADTSSPCGGSCGATQVCRNDSCVELCDVEQAQCGQVSLEGKTDQCGVCSDTQICETGSCVDICTEFGAECGQISFGGATANCANSCNTTSEGCHENRCAEFGFRAITGGFRHACATRSNGLIECWGAQHLGGLNNYGQLGNGGRTAALNPVVVDTLNAAKGLASFYDHSCAWESDGKAWCWGVNTNSQLGDGTDTIRDSPVRVGTMTDIVDTGAGGGHSCAVKDDGSVWCWGGGKVGQLGDGSTHSSPVLDPTQVDSLDSAVEVVLGSIFSCARLSDGTVWCWGSNGDGQLGAGPGSGSSTPKQVRDTTSIDFTEIIDIAAGGAHACAVTRSGDVYCWGAGSNGQLGYGSLGGRSLPVKVISLPPSRRVTAGKEHSCALTQAGEVYCWGKNSFGQLGDSSTTRKSSPSQVSNLSEVVAIGGGYDFSCAVKRDGTAWCWGDNQYGQLAADPGTLGQSDTPVQIQ